MFHCMLICDFDLEDLLIYRYEIYIYKIMFILTNCVYIY